MTISIRAVYEGGVLRPIQALPLQNGEVVDVTIMKSTIATQPISEEEITMRLKNAPTIAEWVDATRCLPPDEGGYDILGVLNENRLRSGERPIIPDKE